MKDKRTKGKTKPKEIEVIAPRAPFRTTVPEDCCHECSGKCHDEKVGWFKRLLRKLWPF